MKLFFLFLFFLFLSVNAQEHEKHCTETYGEQESFIEKIRQHSFYRLGPYISEYNTSETLERAICILVANREKTKECLTFRPNNDIANYSVHVRECLRTLENSMQAHILYISTAKKVCEGQGYWCMAMHVSFSNDLSVDGRWPIVYRSDDIYNAYLKWTKVSEILDRENGISAWLEWIKSTWTVESETLSKTWTYEGYMQMHLDGLVVARFTSFPEKLIDDVKMKFPAMKLTEIRPDGTTSPTVLVFELNYDIFPSEWMKDAPLGGPTFDMLVHRFKNWLIWRMEVYGQLKMQGALDFYPPKDDKRMQYFRGVDVEL